jgi:hypothetical protein
MIEIEISQTAVNEARTSAASDTNVTQRRSLDVLARDLIRIRPKLPASQRDMVSALAVKIMNYAGNPDVMRPKIIWTIEQIENQRRAQ